MTTQDEKYLMIIEELSKKTDSLAKGIKMQDVRIKNRIVRALGEIVYTAASLEIKDKAKDEMKRIKAIPYIASHLQKRFASVKIPMDKYLEKKKVFSL